MPKNVRVDKNTFVLTWEVTEVRSFNRTVIVAKGVHTTFHKQIDTKKGKICRTGLHTGVCHMKFW